MMSNYFVNGTSQSFEVNKFETFEECPKIQNSCCEKKELDTAFNKFKYTV